MQWEYYVHTLPATGWASGEFNTDEMTKMLNWYGSQHWDLVSAVPAARHEGSTTGIVFVFKRPKTAEAPPA